MTPFEWVIFILFNIVLNVVMQVLAWNIAYKIGNKEKKNDTERP